MGREKGGSVSKTTIVRAKDTTGDMIARLSKEDSAQAFYDSLYFGCCFLEIEEATDGAIKVRRVSPLLVRREADGTLSTIRCVSVDVTP